MSDREVMQQALEALCSAVEPKKGKVYAREFEPIDCYAMHEQAITALREALKQPEQEPCIGKDPRCPCQDGGACHYKDCGDTKARPVAQPEQEQALKKLADLGQEIEQEPTCPECKAVVLYECVACSSNNYPPKPEQEPVAFINPPGPITQYSIPTQRQWVGLTDEEITEIYEMGLGVRASIETALDKLEERNT
jgi:hypothetical protein